MYEYRYTYITRTCTSTVFGAVSVYLFFFYSLLYGRRHESYYYCAYEIFFNADPVGTARITMGTYAFRTYILL